MLAVLLSACGAEGLEDATVARADVTGEPAPTELIATTTATNVVDTPTVSDVVDRPTPPPSQDLDGVDGPVVRHTSPYWDEAMLESVNGVLGLEGDCLFLSRPEWPDRYPVVWPAGTAWDAENQAVVTPAGEMLRIGQEVNGGGGFNDGESVEYFAGAEARELVQRCLGDSDQVAIVNNNASAIGAIGVASPDAAELITVGGPIAAVETGPAPELACESHVGGTAEPPAGGIPDGQSPAEAFQRFPDNAGEGGLPTSGYVAHVLDANRITVAWQDESGASLVQVGLVREIDESQGTDTWMLVAFRWCTSVLPTG